MVFSVRPRKEEAGTDVEQDERQGLPHKKAQDEAQDMRRSPRVRPRKQETATG